MKKKKKMYVYVLLSMRDMKANIETVSQLVDIVTGI